MKLATLFGLYLYQHKKLNLPGIGVFSIDPALAVPDAADKNFPEFLQQVQYHQRQVPAADEHFIEFIRTQTGKIKPLAESDLDSFLSDAKILLNIGKPFYLEGIGTLQKNKAGNYDFTPGHPVTQRREGHQVSEHHQEPARRHVVLTENILNNPGTRKLAIFAAVCLAVVLVIWLGYGLYNRNTQDSAGTTPANDTGLTEATVADSLSSQQRANTMATASTGVPPGSYKFIIERTANKNRAYRRFTQIKDNLTDVKMESKPDSSMFSLYFILPAQPADTTRIKDSLKIWYGRKQVFVEK